MADRSVHVGNKAVNDKATKFAQDLHQNNLNNMRPTIQTAPLPVYPHLIERRKRDQMAQGTLECYQQYITITAMCELVWFIFVIYIY